MLDLVEHPPAAQRDRQRDRDRAGARADVDDPDRPGAGRPWGGEQPGDDLRLGQVDDPLGLGSRDQRAGVVANASPWNSLRPRM